MSPDEENMISEFNEAKFQIYRLHGIWIQGRYSREAGDLKGWRWVLDSAEIELSHDLTRLDKGDKLPDEKDTTSWKGRLSEANKKVDDAANKLDYSEIYKALKEKEVILRALQEAAGKGGKLRLDDEDGM